MPANKIFLKKGGNPEFSQNISTKNGNSTNYYNPKKQKKSGFLSPLIILFLTILLIMIFAKNIDFKNQIKISKKETTIVDEQPITTIVDETPKALEIPIFDEFVNNIEQHYSNLVRYYSEKKYDEAYNLIMEFDIHNQLNYKNVSKKYKNLIINYFYKKVKPIPAYKVKENLDLYRKLLDLDPNNIVYKKKVAHYFSKLDENTNY